MKFAKISGIPRASDKPNDERALGTRMPKCCDIYMLGSLCRQQKVGACDEFHPRPSLRRFARISSSDLSLSEARPSITFSICRKKGVRTNEKKPWTFTDVKAQIRRVLGFKLITYQENFDRDNEMALSYSLPCEECPDYLYDYNKIRDSWIDMCNERSPDDGAEAAKFFKRVYRRHLQKTLFVTAFDCSDRAKLFVDYIVYMKIKSKLQRSLGFNLSHIPPVRLTTRKLPCRKHIFASEEDFNRCIENLRRKNDEILFQRNVRGIRLLDQIRKRLKEQPCLILAMDFEVFEDNPKEILEIGYTLFRMVTLETNCHIITCNHYVITDNKHLKNENLMPDNRDKFMFGVTEEISFSAAKTIIEDVVARVDYVVAHAAGSLVDYLDQRGINLHGVQVIDTKLLHTAVCPFVGEHAQRDLYRVMSDFDIPLDSNADTCIDADQVLNNAGNDAFYTMEVFKTLVRLQPITTEYLN
ncbi:hypothetical protein QZH41_002336 [Actinostola sp. cb2023]|nr:hypothetical protein QZH41_002336 [Actinostola sp. cb2023]